jgi:hypothetical protein
MKKQNIVCENVDMKLLHKQKLELVKLIWNNKKTNLWGLVEMLDTIEDSVNSINLKSTSK